MKKLMTTHHICPTSRGGTDEYDNTKMIRDKKHRSLHILFANQTTCEKIRTILEMDKTALQWDFKRDIERILSLYDGLEYHTHVKDPEDIKDYLKLQHF